MHARRGERRVTFVQKLSEQFDVVRGEQTTIGDATAGNRCVTAVHLWSLRPPRLQQWPTEKVHCSAPTEAADSLSPLLPTEHIALRQPFQPESPEHVQQLR